MLKKKTTTTKVKTKTTLPPASKKGIVKPEDFNLRYKICISGAAETGLCSDDCFEKAVLLGKEIARRGIVLVTGATTGVPYWVAKAVKEEGGVVIGFSPAVSKRAHINTYHLPLDYHDVIVYTGFHYSGRNLMLVRSSDAVITLCGRLGTLNEFTAAFEDKKPIGVLTGTGGMADKLEDIVNNAHRGPGKVVFSKDPKQLLDDVVRLIESEDFGTTD